MKEGVIKFMKTHRGYFENTEILNDIAILLCGSYSMMFNFRSIVLDALTAHELFHKIGGVQG